MRAINAIENCDVALLVIDATLGIEQQDLAIFKLAKERYKGVVILVNKWDLEEKDTNYARDYEEIIKNRLAPFNDVPIIFISAKEKQRIFKAIDIATEVAENRKTKIKTSQLNDWLESVQARYSPPAYRGHLIKIKYMTQLPLYYPAFVFFCNYPKQVPDNYKRYLENELRRSFNFTGVPIALFFREK
jgi:GTP-binding protein